MSPGNDARLRVGPIHSIVVGPNRSIVFTALEEHRLAQRREHETLTGLGFSPPSEYLFASPMGYPLDPDRTSQAFQAFAVRAGLGKRHVHELRHAAASLMLAAGTPLPEVSRVLGHSSTRITDEVYAHLGHEALRGAIDRLPGVLDPSET